MSGVLSGCSGERAAWLSLLILVACHDNPMPSDQGSVDLGIADADCARVPAACGGCANDTDCRDPALPACYEGKCVVCSTSPDSCPANQACRRIGGMLRCSTECGENVDCLKLGGGTMCCAGVCISPATDVKNCHSCGITCPPKPHAATPVCMAGGCALACDPGFADCDHSYDNGCEVDLNSDDRNCQICGHRCAPGIGIDSSTCVKGYCMCSSPGRYKCSDGEECDTDVTSDWANCGGCTKTCFPGPNIVSVRCVNSQCVQGACKPGWGDCDGKAPNGCEVNLTNNPGNCGACGQTCPLGTVCSGGMCV